MLKNKHDSKRCHKGVFQTTNSYADILFLFNIQHLYKQSFQIQLLYLQKLALKVFQFYNTNKKVGIWSVKVCILNFLEILGVTKTLHVSWFASGCLLTKYFEPCVTKQKFSSPKPFIIGYHLIMFTHLPMLHGTLLTQMVLQSASFSPGHYEGSLALKE